MLKCEVMASVLMAICWKLHGDHQTAILHTCLPPNSLVCIGGMLNCQECLSKEISSWASHSTVMPQLRLPGPRAHSKIVAGPSQDWCMQLLKSKFKEGKMLPGGKSSSLCIQRS